MFLKNPPDFRNDIPEIDVCEEDIAKANSIFSSDNLTRATLKILPKFAEFQIWTVKSKYVDFCGELQISSHKQMVIIVSEPEALDEDTYFARVCPISPFIEMAASDDLICDDFSVVGFPFLIESWNEQPLLLEILESFVGTYYFNLQESQSDINPEQRTFREIEISNSRFLNRSIIAYTAEQERSNNFSYSVDLFNSGIAKTVRMPIMGISNPNLIELPHNESYAEAAKYGNVITDNDMISFNGEEIPFEMQIRKKEDGFVISIIPKTDIVLFDSRQNPLSFNSNNDRMVFHGLKRGLYSILIKSNNKLLTFRIK